MLIVEPSLLIYFVSGSRLSCLVHAVHLEVVLLACTVVLPAQVLSKSAHLEEEVVMEVVLLVLLEDKVLLQWPSGYR